VLEKGASVNVKHHDGRTMLRSAIKNGHEAMQWCSRLAAPAMAQAYFQLGESLDGEKALIL
jgi:hypothetical protein